MARIGIIGGTFDPIHWGHLIMAEQAWERFELGKVVFVTAAEPPHKPGRVAADARDRHKMTMVAVEGNDHFECSDVEIERPGPSYTVDTLRRIIANSEERIRVYLLVGSDEARHLMTWREPYEIAKLADIAVANRPGCSVDEALAALPADLAERVTPLHMPGVDISSTDIRERVRSGRSIRYLVPGVVEDYIKQVGLYR